jgi:hypothetical protein
MPIDWRAVLRDALIVLILAALGSTAASAMLDDGDGALGAVALVTTLFMIAGFCLGGCLAKARRFRHLGLVAAGVWLASPIVRFGQEPNIALWIVWVAPVAVAMGIGGAISLAIVPRPPADPSVPPSAQA